MELKMCLEKTLGSRRRTTDKCLGLMSVAVRMEMETMHELVLSLTVPGGGEANSTTFMALVQNRFCILEVFMKVNSGLLCILFHSLLNLTFDEQEQQEPQSPTSLNMASPNPPDNVVSEPPRKRQKISPPPSFSTTATAQSSKSVTKMDDSRTQNAVSDNGFQPEREIACGILHFVNSSNPGFSGTLKQRYARNLTSLIPSFLGYCTSIRELRCLVFSNLIRRYTP